MLDLNVDVVSHNSTFDESYVKITIEKLPATAEALTDDSGTSNSSVVNADEAPATAGDANSSCTPDRPSDTTVSAFNFDIFNKGKGSIIRDQCNENSSSELVTRQLFPLADSEEFGSGSSSATSLLRPQWLNLSVPKSGEGPELRIFEQSKQQPNQQKVMKSRRGPRSRSSQYRGVTFYRRTGRWESHIWDCGKQVYLGGFDTAHAAARAYDRAAIRFRGVDADINFNLSDYDEDMKQLKNLKKEECVQILRRQTSGFSRGSSRYRGVTLHKCGRWEARMGQVIGKKYIYLGLFDSEVEAARAYDKAAIEFNGREAFTNFEPSTNDGEVKLVANDGGSGHNLDLNLWISPPPDGPKRNNIVRDLQFHCAGYQLASAKRQRVENSASAPMGGQTPPGLTMASKHLPIWPGMHSGFTPSYEEGTTGKRDAEAVPTLGFSNWAWQMQGHGMVNSLPLFSTAASSGFSSTIPSFSTSLLPPITHNKTPHTSLYNHHQS